MVFRWSTMVLALVAAACSTAKAVEMPMCHITSDSDPKTFETIMVTAEEFAAFEAAGDLDGPCTDWLGQLCDDGLKCTVDYDYELAKCLPFPRESMPTCEETAEEI